MSEPNFHRGAPEPKADGVCCANCGHFDPTNSLDGTGLCRKDTPKAVLQEVEAPHGTVEEIYVGIWPTVATTDRCGHYNPRKTAGVRGS